MQIYNVEDNNIFGDSEQLAYEFYKDWLVEKKDMDLGANRLIDRQLFWVATARTEYRKHQLDSDKNSLRYINYHNFFSSKKGFAEAFECENKTSS